jgi:hypothetical protein
VEYLNSIQVSFHVDAQKDIMTTLVSLRLIPVQLVTHHVVNVAQVVNTVVQNAHQIHTRLPKK